jgi:ferredoxin--NADP+ reductase
MNKILAKKQLSADVYEMTVEAPLIARARKAGQFIIVQSDTGWGERIPLTIADADADAGTVTMVFQTVGASTHKLAVKECGDYIENILGPLGNPTHIENFGSVVCVGGGIGVAPLYPIVQAMKEAGNHVRVIVGARNRELVIFEERMRSYADELIIVTDDGSYGKKALVTEPLREFCAAPDKPDLLKQPDLAKQPDLVKRPDLVVAIGPPIMMKFCEKTTAEFAVPIMVSLNTIMIDGTGMCGGCRVPVGGETKFVCVDGPEFDGHQVDFENMMIRMRSYKAREDADHHACHIGLGLPAPVMPVSPALPAMQK